MATLKDRVALVTGAGSGIGAEIAAAFIREGAKVMLADIDGAAAACQAGTLGPSARSAATDVGDEAAVRDLIANIVAWSGKVDIVVNAAGVILPDTVLTMTEATLSATFRVNVFGLAFVMRYAAEEMLKKGGGKIINLASIAIAKPSPAMAYPASKHAVIGLTRSAAVSLASHNIQVNAIAPGEVDTPMWRGIVARQARLNPQAAATDSFVSSVVKAIPSGRIGLPSEIAGAAVFLASQAADYITGQTLHVNGGGVMC